MIGNLDKLRKILKTGASVGSIFTKGKTKSVLDIVNQTIDDDSEPKNETALRDLAEVNDAQTEVLSDHETRLRDIERRLKI